MFPQPNFDRIPMNLKLFLSYISIIAATAAPRLAAQSSDDPLPFDTTHYRLQEVVYKVTSQDTLRLHCYYPEHSDPDELLPAVLFYFGGGWVGGSHQHFAPHSKYLAARGMMAITADYRVKNQHGTSPIEAIQDARDALQYVARHSQELGVDTTRLAVGGGSAGGHLALSTELIDAFEDDDPLTYHPRALILFNPVVNTTSEGFGAAALGADSIKASPVHHINKNMPPTLVFHGEADTTVPADNVREMQQKMDSLGVDITVHYYPEQVHGFFNIGRQEKHRYFLETLHATDQFLTEHHFLEDEPIFGINNNQEPD